VGLALVEALHDRQVIAGHALVDPDRAPREARLAFLVLPEHHDHHRLAAPAQERLPGDGQRALFGYRDRDGCVHLRLQRPVDVAHRAAQARRSRGRIERARDPVDRAFELSRGEGRDHDRDGRAHRHLRKIGLAEVGVEVDFVGRCVGSDPAACDQLAADLALLDLPGRDLQLLHLLRREQRLALGARRALLRALAGGHQQKCGEQCSHRARRRLHSCRHARAAGEDGSTGDLRRGPPRGGALAGPAVTPASWALARVAQPAEPLDLAAETSLPRWLAQLWSEQLGEAETRALAAALNQRAPLTVRANLLKNTREQLLETLRTEGSRVEPTRCSPWGVTFTGRTNVFALRAFKAGLFEVQDEGSQLIALA